MGGDLNKIQTVGKYMIEVISTSQLLLFQVWKACGMDMKNVQFIWASEEINKYIF